jgi:deoxyadenosine/deoxycytidine kinase
VCQGQFKEFEEKLAAIDADLRYAPTLILHFKITVEAAMTRIQNRAKVEGRWFEKDITEEYLRNLLAKYESLYEGREDRV